MPRHHRALAYPHFTDGDAVFKEVKPPTQGHTAGQDSNWGWPQATACGFFPSGCRPGLPMCCVSLLIAVSLKAAQRPTSFSIPGGMGVGYVLVNMQILGL